MRFTRSRMNIREALLAEHSKRQTTKIVAYIGDDPKRFAELMAVFLGNEYRPTQRAAWVMSNCVEKSPELIKPYISRLVRLLERRDGHDAIRRNIVRLLQFVEVPRNLQGRVYALCYELFDDPAQPIAVRCFALSVAAEIAGKDLALMDELRLVAGKYSGHLSAGLRARTRNVLG